MGKMRRRRQAGGGTRLWAVGLAMLALVVQALAPPGLMVARQGESATIVLCTGHGPVLARSDLTGHPGAPSKSRPDAPCAFAGHGVAAGPTLAAPGARRLTPTSPPPVLARLDVVPGRGLAAPPPPSQGPPTLIH